MNIYASRYFVLACVLLTYLVFVGTGHFLTLVIVLITIYFFWEYVLIPQSESRSEERVLNALDLYQAARSVHESRNATELFLKRNHHETFATARGKSMLLHHLRAYEQYLNRIGCMRNAMGIYNDAYWV